MDRPDFVHRKNDPDPEGKRFEYYSTIPDQSSRKK